MPTSVALIPARSGSTRIPHKNVRYLGDHPLLAYTIAAAIESGIYQDVIVSTDSEHYAEVANHYGAEVPFLRPVEIAGTTSPDIEWVAYTLDSLKQSGRSYDCFSILRPTSPFRQPETIRRAWGEFVGEQGVDSLRAVEKCSEHPGKMWVIQGTRMTPLLPLGPVEQPWHSSQYQSLPVVHVQNASLEIAWTRVVYETKSIAGYTIMPFLTQGYEGFDVNKPVDWMVAEALLHSGEVSLPEIILPPFERKA
jgi:CMP-N,N'-diacetyllegionaminic acid synthase